jgi:glycosyltransferase involved in cell wall biosynthesis
MRVLFLQRQPSFRALKLAAGLRGALAESELAFAFQGDSLNERYGQGDEFFDRLWKLDPDANGLAPLLAEFEPDVVHGFDDLSGRVKGPPVVHDVSDAAELDQRAIESAAALVATSPELLGLLRHHFRLPKRTLVFPNLALRRDLPRLLAFQEHRVAVPPRLVYQGSLATDGGRYDLRAIFESLDNEGFPLDVYPNATVDEYYDLEERLRGLTMHEPRPPADMLRELPKYDFGWAGLNATNEKPQLDTLLPNKVFEYLACGLPVLSFPHAAVRHLLRERGLGVVVSNAREIGLELSRRDLEKLRRRVATARTRLTVEANIDRLVEVYETLTGVRGGVEADAVSLNDL